MRGGVEDLSAPKIFFSPKGDKFVRSVLDLEPRRLALKFESFVVSGLGNYFKLLHNRLIHSSSADNIDSAIQHESRPLNKLVGDCRKAIQKGLGKLLCICSVQLTV